MSEDLSECDIILGVKEIPNNHIVPGKVHFCFSHSHKGQPKGAEILRGFHDANATLVDYELLVDERGDRLVAFGKYAGYAGMINCLNGLGERLLEFGLRTPLLNVSLAHHYPSLTAAKKALKSVAADIGKSGLPNSVKGLSFIFLGDGNVSKGAQEIFRLFPHEYVKPEDFGKRAVKDDRFIATVLQLSDYLDKEGNSIFHQKVSYIPINLILWRTVYLA